MAYRAKVVKVMIASPGDVSAERQVIRNVIQEWNYTHSEDKNLVLMPVGWESHATPSMGERPQALINKQVLKSCDLLIAVFWTRLGTPTGKASSGTVEEIEEHLKAKKPAAAATTAKKKPTPPAPKPGEPKPEAPPEKEGEPAGSPTASGDKPEGSKEGEGGKKIDF